MAFEYGEEVDSSGNITHTGSWGAKSIPKDAMARIIEDLRLVYDEPTAGTTAALALKANIADMTTALALKLDISSLPSTINSVGIGGSATGITIYDNTKVTKSGDTMTGALILSGDPTVALGAATKQYADNNFAPAGYGLGGSGTRLTGGTNLNNIIANGWYDVNSPINGPIALSSNYQKLLVVCSNDTSAVTQLVFSSSTTSGQPTNSMYMRELFSTVWSTWEQIAKTDGTVENSNTVINAGVGVCNATGINIDDPSLKTGFYYAASGTSPVGVVDGCFIHQSYSNVYARQIFIEYNSSTTNPRLWIRALQNSVWYAWKLIG